MSQDAAVAETTQTMTDVSIRDQPADAPTKSTIKRDTLRAQEVSIQAEWEAQKVFEANPDARESFMVTFPYPYANGHLHIGHGFSLTKAIFRAQYERHRGKNVLFPFAFHCTGMPIQAVSRKQVHVHALRLCSGKCTVRDVYCLAELRVYCAK
jgi:isoleucyl-tRNA synthetase